MATTTSPSTVPGEWDRSLSARAERYAAGKALRARVHRTRHAEWAPDPARPDPISLLEASNSTRLEHLVPHPLWTYGDVSVRILARFGGCHGERPGQDARLRHPGAALR